MAVDISPPAVTVVEAVPGEAEAAEQAEEDEAGADRDGDDVCIAAAPAAVSFVATPFNGVFKKSLLICFLPNFPDTV